MRPLLAGMLLVAIACGSPRQPMTPQNPDETTSTSGADAGPAATADAAPTGSIEPAPPDPAKVKVDLLAAESAAFASAKPVFDKHCAKCHTKDGKNATAKKLEHFDMTTYPFGGHHAGEMGATIRKVLAIDGGKATMPADKKGTVKGDELAQIKVWADAFDASHAVGAHEGVPGHGHDH